ncbi:hypothetical protein [Oceanospirillum beijerinckii]|uniref:hypothetical protein n=1 Tax=Oceanospirillum beijerinckii TaxID=64976 RepID=UPI00041D2D02|nr:hypothetical protein [Oceanospirillum beijerinckii]
MTPWTNLLITTVRLLDLHDSNHEQRSPHVRVAQQPRPGLKNGYWLDLACLLLDYLLEEDFLTNGGFISHSCCLGFVREYYPNCSSDDLQFVVNTLATPSELIYINRQPGQSHEQQAPIASTKRTSLIEKQAQTGHVRLTSSGRQAVNLAGQVEDVLYSEYDAAKALTAITRGDYGRVPDICNSILLAIRGLTQEIRQIRENPTRESKLLAFQENQRHYHNALNSIQRTILDCRTQLLRPEQQHSFEQWQQQNHQEWDLLMLTQSLNRVVNAIENLSRRLTELLTDIADGRIRSMGVIDFSQLAQDIALKPPVQALTDTVAERCMPFYIETMFPSPNDFTSNLLDQRSERSEEALVFDSTDNEHYQDTALHTFLQHRSESICQHLQQQPLTLSEALDKGWHQIEGEDFLPQLLNMYVDPEQLQADLVVALDPNHSLEITLPDGRVLKGDNPILMLRQPHAQDDQ